MLGLEPVGVLQRHVVAGERREPGTQRAVQRIERRLCERAQAQASAGGQVHTR